MSKKNLPTKVYRDHAIEEVKRLRYWFAGFKAAGGKLPQCIETLNCLVKIQTLLEKVEVSE